MGLPSEMVRLCLNMYYVYVLQNKKDQKTYYGFTGNLTQRFEHHNKGKVESTRERLPMSLIYYEACLSKDDALHREKYFKSYRAWATVSCKAAQIVFHRLVQ